VVTFRRTARKSDRGLLRHCARTAAPGQHAVPAAGQQLIMKVGWAAAGQRGPGEKSQVKDLDHKRLSGIAP
jgi:hypothetical protein